MGRSAPILADLGAWVASLTPASLPTDTLRAARYQLLDMVAAAHAAGESPETRSIEPALLATGGEGRATVLATGRRAPPVEAAMANAAFSMAQDFDDIIWMGHSCHSAIFAPLAVAEQEGSSSAELLVAVVAANEVAGRLGASSFLGPLNGQMWSFLHLIGAAAATARLLRLDARQTTHALAISLAQPTFALQPGFFRPTSKLLTASTPTATGIRAAYFARAGMTGEPGILEDPRGFWRRFSFLPLPGMMGGLGEFWATQTLAIKTFPGCFYFQTACSALVELRARLGGELAEAGVEEVRIETTKLATEVTRFAADHVAPDELAPVNVNFDLGLTAAILLHAGQLTSAQNDAGWLSANEGAIRRWRRKVSVEHDPRLTAKVLGSARAVSAGRDALGAIGLKELVGLVRRYRAEYRSSLVTPAEVAGWFRAALAPARGVGLARAGSTIPLLFPSRVTVTLRGGRRESVQHDLPVASFASPAIEQELRQKFERECGAALGVDGACAAFELGLHAEDHPVSELVAAFARPRAAGRPSAR